MISRKIVELLNGDKSYELAFVFCLPGKYRINNLASLASKNSLVEFSKGYWMQETTVSLGLYEFVYQKPYFEIGSYTELNTNEKLLFPWHGIDFREIKDFIALLNKIVLANKHTFFFDIPSIAEWEHALLTGKDETWSWGYGDDEIKDFAWYKDNSGNKVHASKQKKPNDWGLYDMYGNIYERCYDCVFHDKINYYLDPAIQNPFIEKTSPCLGGSFDCTASECQNVRFIGYENDFIEPVGLRLIQRDSPIISSSEI